MRKNQGVELVLKPINMHGGGYSNFLQKIKTESQSNYLAKFIIMDADRIATVPGELQDSECKGKYTTFYYYGQSGF